MTKSAHQLMWDKEFVEERLKEQVEYIKRYQSTTDTRTRDVLRSAWYIYDRFERQLENINKLK